MMSRMAKNKDRIGFMYVGNSDCATLHTMMLGAGAGRRAGVRGGA